MSILNFGLDLMLHCLKSSVAAGKMAQQLRGYSTVLENLILVPSIHVRAITTPALKNLTVLETASSLTWHLQQ